MGKCGGGVAEVEERLTPSFVSFSDSPRRRQISVRIVRLLISHGADVNHIATGAHQLPVSWQSMLRNSC